MTLFRVAGFLLIGGLAIEGHGQTLCDVAKVTRRENTVEIQFKGTKNYSGLAKGVVADELKIMPDGIIVSGKKSELLSGTSGAKFYLAHGMSDSCVLSIEEQDGRLGLYLEEHYHVRGEPPGLKTEFVEAY